MVENNSTKNLLIRNLDYNDIIIDGNKFKVENKSEFGSNITFLKLEIHFYKLLDSMKKMFNNISELTYINLSSLKTNKITNLNYTFSNCTNLLNISFDNFKSDKLKYMDSTFENCSSLETLELSLFKAPPLKSMEKTFKNCENLTSLNLSNFKLEKNAIINNGTFDSTDKMEYIYINDNISDFFKSITNIKKTINIDLNCSYNFNCSECDVAHKYMCKNNSGVEDSSEDKNESDIIL